MVLLLVCTGSAKPNSLAEDHPAEQIVAVVEKMIQVFEGLGDFSCDVEVRYYRDAKEDKTYCFTWFQEQKDITRVRFSSPHRGLTAVYKRGDAKVTLQPFPVLPFMKFKLALHHSLLRTPSGQRMDHASIEYLSRFFYANRSLMQHHELSMSEEADRVAFSFWASDYTGGLGLNRYHVLVSKDDWLPLLMERSNARSEPIEVIRFKRFVWSAR
jgi:hypothetical protein